MGDTEINIWIMVTVILVVTIARLKWANRKLRKELDAKATLPAASPVPAIAGESDRDREITRLRDRMAVLERIAVEKENTLAREIDELRQG